VIIVTYGAPHFTILCCLLLLSPPATQISSSVPCSRTQPDHTMPQQEKFCSVCFNIYASNNNKTWFNCISTQKLMVLKHEIQLEVKL